MRTRLLRWTLWSLVLALVMGCASREPAPTPQVTQASPVVQVEVSQPEPTPAPEPTKEMARVTAGRLNVRSGPSSKSSILGVFEKGDPVEVLTRKKDWVEVQSAEGRRGWVSARYLSSDAPVPAMAAPDRTAANPAAAGPSKSKALSQSEGLALYRRFRRALADGDFKAFLDVVHAPGKDVETAPGAALTPESFVEMKDLVLEMSPDPEASRPVKFDSDDKTAILVFRTDPDNPDSITLSAVSMAALEGKWKILPGSHDESFSRENPQADKAAIAEKLKTSRMLQLSAVAAKVAPKAAVEAPPAAVPAGANAAEGELVVNGEATALKYAYAYSEPGFFDNSKLDTVVILSNMALDEKALTGWVRRQELEKSGKLRCVELTIDAGGQVISRKLRHAAFEASPSGVSTQEVFEPLAAGEGFIAGRAYSTQEGEFFGVTYRYRASFKARIRQADASSGVAGAAPARASIFGDAPEHQAILKMLETEGETEILQTANGIGMVIDEDFASVSIDYVHQGETSSTAVYLFKEDGAWVAYRDLPMHKDHRAVFLTLAQQYCAPRYAHLQGISFLDEGWQSPDPDRRTVHIDCSEVIDNQWKENRLRVIYQYDRQTGWAITGVQPVQMTSPPETAAAAEESIPVEAPAPAPQTVEAPTHPSALDRLPKIEPVGNVQGQDAGVTYTSAASLPKIISFYTETMTRQGWKISDTLTDNENYANLNFTKNKELLIISLGRDSGAATPRVMVSLTAHGSLKAKDLPRYPGTRALSEFDHTAIYLTADSVEKVHQRTMELLTEAGWQERRAPAGGADNVSFEMKKGDMLLVVYISVAPARGNKTTIQYSLRKKDLSVLSDNL